MPSYCIDILFILLLIAKWTFALRLGVLLPLYVWPGSNCEAWNSVTDAISAYSATQWYIVINPNNGPGPLESSSESLYQKCVAALPSSDNQIVMGFIKTTEGNVTADIDTYAEWDASSRPNGIFFDNISSTESMLDTYQTYVSYAKDRGFSFIGLDPGKTVPSSFLSLGDLVNTYQSNFSTFDPGSLTGTPYKQSVYLTNAPTAAESYTSIISTLESMGVAAVYIANVPDTSQELPVQLSEFVSEVANAGGFDGSENPSQSLALAASSVFAQSTPSSTHLNPNPNQSPSTGTRSPPIASIVGGVLGAVVFILVVVVIFMCVHRRRRPPGSLETGAATPGPFAHWHGQAAVDSNLNDTQTPGAPALWDGDDKEQLSRASFVGTSAAMDPGTLSSSAPRLSVYTQARLSYLIVADTHTSAAPIYYPESEPRLSAGPPPPYQS